MAGKLTAHSPQSAVILAGNSTPYEKDLLARVEDLEDEIIEKMNYAYPLSHTPLGNMHSGQLFYENDYIGIQTSAQGQTSQPTSIKAYTASKTNSLLNTKADASNIPTKTSDLTNDSGFITSSETPTASIVKSGNTATITITDKNGTTTVNISDGSDYILTNQDKSDIADIVIAAIGSADTTQY